MKNNIMTQEEKSLLLQDLCARLPYGIKLKRFDGEIVELTPLLFATFAIENFKPYLRPMSSMTGEEKEEYEDLDYLIRYATNSIYASERLLDFCNSHYLDYHGLIGRGLALEAPQGMYNKMEE